MIWTVELAAVLDEAPFPATREELIEWAERTGLPIQAIDNLYELDEIAEGEDTVYEGIEDIWKIILDFYSKMSAEDRIETKRDDQVLKWLKELFFEKVNSKILSEPEFENNLNSLHQNVLKNKLSVIEASESLFNDTFKEFNK
jgi:putative protein kinase ArgK-like GTPase of G3E family